MIAKIFGYLVAIIVLFWALGFAINNPVQAGHDVHAIFSGIFGFLGAVSK
jgi:hypothetical protein